MKIHKYGWYSFFILLFGFEIPVMLCYNVFNLGYVELFLIFVFSLLNMFTFIAFTYEDEEDKK